VLYLGYTINSRTLTISVPLAKLSATARACKEFLSAPPSRTTLRAALRLAGKVRCLHLVAPHVLPATRRVTAWCSARFSALRSRSTVQQARGFDQATGPWPLPVRLEVQQLLDATLSAIASSRAAGASTWCRPALPDPHLAPLNPQLARASWNIAVIESDASGSGWGATARFYRSDRSTLATPTATRATAAHWPQPTASSPTDLITNTSSINARELYAAVASASTLLPLLVPPQDRARTLIILMTDNRSARSYLDKQTGRFDHLYKIVRQLTRWATAAGFAPQNLWAVYLPGKENGRADMLSRLPWRHELQLHPALSRTSGDAASRDAARCSICSAASCVASRRASNGSRAGRRRSWRAASAASTWTRSTRSATGRRCRRRGATRRAC
jgi:hypothetical protein